MAAEPEFVEVIRIVKPEIPPRLLAGPNARGQKETDSLKAAYDEGQRQFQFRADIYAAESVKRALIQAQHGKCCFCESKLRHVAYGDVEHFRPKAAFRQERADPLSQPGYYWLAYDWSNLLLTCQICNQREKGNLFPLKNPSQRARSHHSDVDRERPLFIDPEKDDPESLIGFREEVPYAKNGSRRATVTIIALGLRRRELNEERFDRLQKVKLLAEVVRLLQQRAAGIGAPLSSKERRLMTKVERHLQSLCGVDAEFSSMIKSALKDMVQTAHS